MKLLMENWRRYLTESVDSRIERMIDEIEEVGFKIGVSGTVSYSQRDNPGAKPAWYDIMLLDEAGGYMQGNNVRIKSNGANEFGECLYGSNAWYIAGAGSDEEVGPLLYDVAIELASQMGGGLMSGRYSVSGEAADVWDKYDDRGDVDSEQLDIELAFRSNPHALAQLTPDDDTDDCIQNSAVDYGHETDERDPWSWSDRSLSRIFRKRRTPVMDELRKRGLLVMMRNGKV